MQDQISALLDGELDDVEAARLLARLKSEPGLRRAWDEYLQVGDALRGNYSRDLTAAVCVRLAAEPTVLAPRPASTRTQVFGRWALSAAAGAAGIALVAWMAIPARSPAPQLAQSRTAVEAQTAAIAAALPAVSPVPAPERVAGAPQTAQAGKTQGSAAMSAHGMGNYLLAHQRFSPANAMQGVAPYVRTVSSAGEQR